MKVTKKELLEHYLEGKAADDMADVFQGWVCGGSDDPELDSELEEYFDRTVTFRKPGRKTHMRYAELQKALGFKASVPLTKRLAFRWVAVLVPVLLIAGAVLYFGRTGATGESDLMAGETVMEGITVITEPGKRKQLELEDNSTVMVNGDTRIIYADDFKVRREVYVEGEAHFFVEKDPNIPFFVKTKYVTVEVTGTEFNVRAVPDEERTTVSLVRGSVNITAGEEKTALELGNEFSFDHESGTATVEPFSGSEWWKEPISFRDRTLVEIFDSVEEYYGISMQGKEPLTDTLRYNISFDRDGSSAVELLEILSRYSGRFTFTDDGNSIVLTKTAVK